MANLRSATEVVEYDNNQSAMSLGSLKVDLSEKKVLNTTAKPAIGYEDKEQGSIVGNGIMSYPCASGCFAKGEWRVLYTLKTDVKDEKFRVTFSNLKLAWPASDNKDYPYAANMGSPVQSEAQLTDIKKGLLTLGETLSSSLSKSKANGNW